MKPKYPCPYPPGGMCPPECITNDGPLCDFDDDCPYATRRMNEHDSTGVFDWYKAGGGVVMSDLIERQSALGVCKEYSWFDDDDFIDGYNTAVKDISEAIKELPTVEAEPVRYGRWIDKGDYAVCTECGGHSSTQYDGVEPIPLMSLFCQYCGARNVVDMDGGDSGQITKMRDMFHRIRLVIDMYLANVQSTTFHTHSDCLQKHNGSYDYSYVWCRDGEVCELNAKLLESQKEIMIFTCIPMVTISETSIYVHRENVDRSKLNDLYPKFFENLIEEIRHELFDHDESMPPEKG